MEKNKDLTYLCTHLGNLLGVPVRLFEKEKQTFYYSFVSLPKDPFLPYKQEVFAMSDDVGYFTTPYDFYFGVIRFGNGRIVLGPVPHGPLSEQTIREAAFLSDVKKEEMVAVRRA